MESCNSQSISRISGHVGTVESDRHQIQSTTKLKNDTVSSHSTFIVRKPALSASQDRRPSPVATLKLLPLELTEAIIEYTPFADRLNLVKTCKTLYHAALPFLLRQIPVRGNPNADLRRVVLLLRTLLENDALASHVCEISLEGPVSSDVVSSARVVDSRKHHIRNVRMLRKELIGGAWLYGQAVDDTRLSSPWPGTWKRAIGIYGTSMDFAAMVALVISRCANLRELRLRDTHQLWFDLILQKAVYPPADVQESCCFKRLSTVELAFGKSLTINLSPALLVFYLPNLADLTLNGMSNLRQYEHFRPECWPLPIPPVASKLKRLRFIDCWTEPCTMKHILSQTPNLTSLTYDIKLVYESSTGLDLTDLRNALEVVRETLEELTLGYEVCKFNWRRNDNFYPSFGCFGTFKTFTSLRKLETCIGLLLGPGITVNEVPPLADVLPPNLHNLILTDDLCYEQSQIAPDTEMLKVLRAYLSDNLSWAPVWKSATPHLQTFTMTVRKSCSEYCNFWIAARDEIYVMCARQGLQYRMDGPPVARIESFQVPRTRNRHWEPLFPQLRN